MKVVNISYDDYANLAHDNAEAMRSIGINALCFKLVRHAFAYHLQGAVVTIHQMQRQIESADIVQIFHSWQGGLDLCLKANKKRIMVYHTGTPYRRNKEDMNALFNPHTEISFTDQTEFIGTGMKNEQYITTAINMKKYPAPVFKTEENKIFAHYPSNPDVKGTTEIIAMMQKVHQARFHFDTTKVSHEEQIKRMALCDIYIELFKPELHGKPYGCYGVCAFEAAAMGKVVLTNNLNPQVYRDTYGHSYFLIANTEAEFINSIETLLSAPAEEITYHKQMTYTWLKENHSYEAIGNQLKKLLNI